MDRFDFIYRRFNKAADQAAGVAAELVTEYEEGSQPHATDMFRVSTSRESREGEQGNMALTDYIRQAMDMEKEGTTREIWLQEKIGIEKDDLKQTPKAILKAILEMMRNTSGKANYGTSMQYNGKGRFYAKGHSVAATGKCPEIARYIMLKKEHYGADVQGCHFAIAVSFLREDEKTHPPYLGAVEAKAYLGEQVGERPDKKEIVKTIMKLLISGTVEGIRRATREQFNWNLPDTVDHFVKTSLTKKEGLWRCACIACMVRGLKKNIMYSEPGCTDCAKQWKLA